LTGKFFFPADVRLFLKGTPLHQRDTSLNLAYTIEAEVIEAYGQPKEDYSGGFPITCRRMVFEGIDFRFENNVMVRIGILGK
jgi:hypothetical protein